MRTVLLLAYCMVATIGRAQDWALINPAYKYNYSSDGTDTISNQIFVTHIDTLGVDSFRYELNLVGVVCDTCSGSWSCTGCFVRVDQPQFLGYNCIRAGNDWLFQGPDTVLIRSNANVGSGWTFNEADVIMAIVDEEWAAEIFGVPDTLQRILLSDGDSIILSRSFGIASIYHGQHHVMVGVEGADVGVLFPDPLDYFDYEVGDELTYKVSSIYQVDPPGDWGYWQWRSHYWMVRITGRTETDTSIYYTTSTAQTFDNVPTHGSLDETPNWPAPTNSWSFGRTITMSEHPLLGAYPGQVLRGTICWGNNYGYLATAGITENGRWVTRAQNFGFLDSEPVNGFALFQESQPGIFAGVPNAAWRYHLNAWYEEGMGLREVKIWRWWTSIPLEASVTLVGAILSGDTVIQPPPINWAVGIDEESTSDWQIAPNPTSEKVSIQGVPIASRLVIRTLQGQTVVTRRTSSSIEIIDVRDLAPGIYLVTIIGLPPQRLVIAR